MSATTKSDAKFYQRSRTTGQCKTCQTQIPKGEPAWWGPRSGWNCQACSQSSRLVSIYRCTLVRETDLEFGQKVNGSEAAGQIACQLLKDSPNERVLAILLDTQLQVIGVCEVSSGVLDATLVHPREFFRPAIIANAHSLIIAHNHPSGNLRPSSQDQQMFDKLKLASAIIGIPVLDSIICNGSGEHYSMASNA